MPSRSHPRGRSRGRSGRPPRPWLLPVIGVAVLGLVATTLFAVLLSARDSGVPGNENGGLPDEPAGTLLAATVIGKGLPDGVEGWRIRYVTQDGRDRKVETTGVVLAAKGDFDRPRPLLSHAHGTSGIQKECAPSLLDDQFPVLPPGAVPELLTDGWVVAQADYIGLGLDGPDGPHPYLDGPSEAHAVLDASRAAHQLDDLDLSDETVIMGASQGGHAALFAGALADDYAPELEVLGVAASAPATDLVDVVDRAPDDLVSFVLTSMIAVSWDALHPDAGIRDEVSDFAAARTVASVCNNAAGRVALGEMDEAPLVDDIASAGRFGELLREATPTGRIDAPLVVAQGLADPIVRPPAQTRWVKERCADGQEIDYRTFPGLTHQTILAPQSPWVPQLTQWVRDRLDGAPPTPTC